MSKMGEIAAGLYPDGLPGWTEPTTSRMAAKAMRSRAATLREKILELLGMHPAGLTPDEASGLLNETVLAVRPRFVELGPKHMGLIEKTGTRRTNDSGMSATVWRVRQ